MPNIVSIDPFRCRVWNFHDRLEHLISEQTCSSEIESFSKHGQLTPALGRPIRGDDEYDIELICGARRLFVARHLKAPLVVDIREMTDRAAFIAMDIENRQRLDVSPYERGMSFARWLRAGQFKSQDDLAKALKISQSQVSRLLTLARLPAAVVNAFANPVDIREGWGPDLAEALEDPRRRQATIAKARAITELSPRPNANEVYRRLLSASSGRFRIQNRTHDEVVTDTDGSPLFRIRSLDKSISFLLPREISQAVLSAVRDAVRSVLQAKKDARASPMTKLNAACEQPVGTEVNGVPGNGRRIEHREQM